MPNSGLVRLGPSANSPMLGPAPPPMMGPPVPFMYGGEVLPYGPPPYAAKTLVG